MTHAEQPTLDLFPEQIEEQVDVPVDSAIMRVRECAEDRYEVDFTLALCGVSFGMKPVRNGESREKGPRMNDNLKSLLTGVGPGQILDFRYGWCHESEQPPRFRWEVIGTGIDSDGPAALSSARELYHALRSVVGEPELGLKFSPTETSPAAPARESKWNYLLEPAAISILATPSSPIGYTADADLPQKKMVVLGYPTFQSEQHFDSIIRIGRGSPASFTLSLRVEARILGATELEALDLAFNQLRTGKVCQLHLEGSTAGYLYDEKILLTTLRRLERWLAEPHGCQARCTVESDAPLPPSLLTIMGRELFGGVPLSVRQVSVAAVGRKQNHQGIMSLAGCFHHADFSLNLIPNRERLQLVGVPRAYTMPLMDLADGGLVLGRCCQQHQISPVRLDDVDRTRHCSVMGGTGTGKSTLLRSMISQGMERGENLCLLDPHGDLYEQVLESIPEERAQDVILIDLADTEYSVGLNFLECSGPNRALQMNFITNEMMSIFHRLYNMDLAGGPVFETYMRNCLLAVMGNPRRTATLLDVVRFFEDDHFRAYINARCENPLVVSFWKKQAAQAGGEHSLINMAPYITSKLNQFTHNDLLRPIIGQAKTTIDFRGAMDQGKIILVNLAKGLLGEFDIRLLGMLLIGKIFSSALARIVLPAAERRPFYLYIDEFQNLATETVIGLVSEARKFGLSLVMANQHLGQFSDQTGMRGVEDAILGNVASMLFFRMGPNDAEKLASYTKPYLGAEDLQNLPDYHVACRMLRNNVPVPSFVFETIRAQQVGMTGEQAALVEQIRSVSRSVYAQPRDKVERAIMDEWTKQKDHKETAES
jgi:hypothetical protein